MGHRDDLLVTRQYTRMTNPAGGPPTRSVCLLGFVQVGFLETCLRTSRSRLLHLLQKPTAPVVTLRARTLPITRLNAVYKVDGDRKSCSPFAAGSTGNPRSEE